MYNLILVNLLLQVIVITNGKTLWKQGPSETNLYVMPKFTESPKTPGITLKIHGFL